MRMYTLAILAALAAPAALAQEDQTVPPEHLAAMDANRDQVVDESEFHQFMERVFNELDTNADRFVSWVEAEVTMAREHFDGADANGDGGISQEEMRAQAQRDFDAADQDGNGQLD